jgi:flavodoxin short chain
MKVNIIYWSGTGNTEAMAELIREGAESTGAEVTLKEIVQASGADLDCDVLALGCSAMGAEVLEEDEFEPYFASIEGSLAGRRLALFGSYGWGDGEWMRDWTQRSEIAGAVLVAEGLMVNEMPTGEDVERCRDFGAMIAA